MGSKIDLEGDILNQAIEDFLPEGYKIINIQKVEQPIYQYRFYIYATKEK